MFRTGTHFSLLVLVIGLVLMRESRQDPLRQFDESYADFAARNSHRTESPAPLTLIEIGETSLKDHPWPWTPLDFALFFQAANNFKPEALATDEVLRWDDPQNEQTKLPQYKKILREHILRSPKVLLGARFGFPDDPQVIPPLEEVPLLSRINGDVSAIPEFTAVAAQAEEDFRLANVAGFTNLPGGNQQHHSVPLLLRYRGQIVPSFALQAVMIWEKVTADEVTVEAGREIVIGSQLRIPVDERGEMRVDFGVPRARCTFDDLVLASAQVDAHMPTAISPDLLNGKMLLLGRNDADARTLQLAAGRKGSAGELFSAAIATIQNRSFLRRAPVSVEFAIVALAVVISFFAPRWHPRTVILAAPVALVVYTMFTLAIFGTTLIWLPIVLPAGLAIFIALNRLVLPRHP